MFVALQTKGLLPKGLVVPYVLPDIKTRFPAFKETALPSVLSFQPHKLEFLSNVIT